MDWAQTGMTSFSHSLIFTTSFIAYGIVTMTIDEVTSFLQLLDVQIVHKNTRFSPNKSDRKFKQSVQDGGIVIDSKIFVNILNLLCVRIEINSHCSSDLLLNISLSVVQS